MITLSNSYKTIKISLANSLELNFDEIDKKDYYKVELPEIICSSKQDAERMQHDINNFVNELSHKLLS